MQAMSLEIRETIGGLKHYVNGVQLQPGAQIEIRLGDIWVSGRYECSLKSPESPIWFYYSADKRPLQLPNDMEVRLPSTVLQQSAPQRALNATL